MLLKRLAFVIFCSEYDQYHKYMPEIQGTNFPENFTQEIIFTIFTFPQQKTLQVAFACHRLSPQYRQQYFCALEFCCYAFRLIM